MLAQLSCWKSNVLQGLLSFLGTTTICEHHSVGSPAGTASIIPFLMPSNCSRSSCRSGVETGIASGRTSGHRWIWYGRLCIFRGGACHTVIIMHSKYSKNFISRWSTFPSSCFYAIHTDFRRGRHLSTSAFMLSSLRPLTTSLPNMYSSKEHRRLLHWNLHKPAKARHLDTYAHMLSLGACEYAKKYD